MCMNILNVYVTDDLLYLVRVISVVHSDTVYPSISLHIYVNLTISKRTLDYIADRYFHLSFARFYEGNLGWERDAS